MKKVFPYIRVGTYEQAGTTEEAERQRRQIEALKDYAEFYASVSFPAQTERTRLILEARQKRSTEIKK